MSKTYRNAKEVLKRAREIYQDDIHPFKTIDINHRLKSGGNKGNLGQIVEEGWFNIDVNSRHEKDFPEANLELKLIPYIKDRKEELKGKERLVVSMINYKEEAKISKFEDSSFWKKADQILIMTYEHRYDKEKGDYYVDYARIFRIPQNDLEIIKNDWQIIHNYIVNGKAHELSESLTNYLGACTKGSNSENLVSQHDSDIKAMPRAYCLKSSYVNSLIKNSLFVDDEYPQGELADSTLSVLDVNETSNLLEVKVNNALNQYVGMDINTIVSNLGFHSKNKGINNLLINEILRRFDLNLIDELTKSNTIIKTVVLDDKKKINLKESMSFPSFRFLEIVNEEWDTSKQREYFEDLRILFIVFVRKNDEVKLYKHFFYTLGNFELKEISNVYKRLRNILMAGHVFEFDHVRKIYKNRLPKAIDNPVAHIRPHASKADYNKNGKNADWIPSDNTWMTKQCFWLNSKYIKKIILSQI